MVAWAFDKAFHLLEKLGSSAKAIQQKLNLNEEELNHWKEISQKLNVVISDEGIISQYDGSFGLKELDWDHYKKKYGNIYRLDRILKAEGTSADEFKVAKQADTLMTFYNLDDEEVRNILLKLGYNLKPDYLKENMSYYLGRTSHGSTLSRVVHALLANMIGDRELSWELYQDALGSDYVDIQGGTTAEGIHLGVMAGTVLIAMHAYAGLNLRGETIRIEPNMPKAWRSIRFGFSFQGQRFMLKVCHHGFSIEHADNTGKETQILTSGKSYKLIPGNKLTVEF
jgi:trehalose/maltose hydrolase-like predicted phosphorylase